MKIKLFTIPNLLTLSNLLCGSFAAVSALVYGDLRSAFWLIIAAAVFDFFDGFAARLLKCPSAIGVELDSLADMVSFGFAPAAVLYVLYGQAPVPEAWSGAVLTAGHYAVFVLAAFSALRLAKFNIDDTQHTEFCGLPTPACALFCVSLGLLSVSGELVIGKIPILIIAIVMSCLLISPIRMFALKFKGFGWKGNELRYGFILVSAGLVAVLREASIPIIILLYIAVSTVRWVMMLRTHKSESCSGR